MSELTLSFAIPELEAETVPENAFAGAKGAKGANFCGYGFGALAGQKLYSKGAK